MQGYYKLFLVQQKTALDNFLYKTVCINVQASVIVNLSGSGVSPVNFFLLLGDENPAMKFGVDNIVVLIVVIVNSLCGAARRTHFRSVGKNYNINYNSNTNTNFDFTQLYRTILEHISESEIKASSCPQGRCDQHLYEHFTASFSSDQDEDEEDYFYYDEYDDIDEGNLFSTDGSVKEAAGTIHFTDEGNDHIARLKPTSADDTKLQIRQLDAETEASAISATVPYPRIVNQSDQMISLDSISVESSSDQQESDFESFSSNPNI